MEKSVQELAEFLKGTVEHDNPELRITGVNGLVEAGPKDISFAVPPHAVRDRIIIKVIISASIFFKSGNLQFIFVSKRDALAVTGN